MLTCCSIETFIGLVGCYGDFYWSCWLLWRLLLVLLVAMETFIGLVGCYGDLLILLVVWLFKLVPKSNDFNKKSNMEFSHSVNLCTFLCILFSFCRKSCQSFSINSLST